MTDTTTDIVGKYGTMRQAEEAITALGAGAPRIARCGEYGTALTHFLVWPATSGVTLRNMACPEHGARWVTQTVHGTPGSAWAISKAFVKSIADKANTAKAAKTAEAEAAGTTRKVRDLAVGDVFLYSTKSYHRVELPTSAVLRVVAVTKLPKGRVELTVVGSAASYEAARGAYSRPYNLNGVERDLFVATVTITGSISGTAQVITHPDGLDRRYYGHEELVAAVAGELRWADALDLDAAELDRLSNVAKARAEYLARVEAELAELDAKIADPQAHAHVTQSVERYVAIKSAERERRAAHVETCRADLAVVEARLDELAKAVSSPAIADAPEPDTDADLRLAGGNPATATALAAERAAVEEAIAGGDLGEEDTLPAAVCGNCLAFAGERTHRGEEVVITFDEASGRRLCQECEPAPMVDGIRAGQAVRIGPKAGANAGREAVTIRHEGTGTVVQILGQGIERLYHRSELAIIDNP